MNNEDALNRNSWSSILTPILNTNYMKSVDLFLKQEYATKIVYPIQRNIYKPFHYCNYDNLKVVILSNGLYHDGRATGIPFANDGVPLDGLSLALQMIRDAVNIDCYYNDCLEEDFPKMDYTLEEWSEQGVLLLNTWLTTVKNDPGGHKFMWGKFVSSLLKNINKDTSGIIYLLWGTSAMEFSKYIDKSKNIVFYASHPASPILENKKVWECNHFTEVNNLLNEHNQILW